MYIYFRTHPEAINDMEKDIQFPSDQLHKDEVINDDLQQFSNTLSGLVSTYFQRYIKNVFQADQFLLREFLPPRQ